MSATGDADGLWTAIDRGDRDALPALADLLDDAGDPLGAECLRWCWRAGRWPTNYDRGDHLRRWFMLSSYVITLADAERGFANPPGIIPCVGIMVPFGSLHRHHAEFAEGSTVAAVFHAFCDRWRAAPPEHRAHLLGLLAHAGTGTIPAIAAAVVDPAATAR